MLSEIIVQLQPSIPEKLRILIAIMNNLEFSTQRNSRVVRTTLINRKTGAEVPSSDDQ